MKYKKLIIEKKESATIKRLMLQAGHNEDSIYSSSVAKLGEELRSADTLDEAEMPAEVVRLNSIITISAPHNKKKSFQLVLPNQSNIAENKLSVLAPMGLALFGYAEGDQVLWEFPSGLNKIKILKVEQPALQIPDNKFHL
jgi:regulator of nucleoside diphosphate kinase